jgi:hypothetical protein
MENVKLIVIAIVGLIALLGIGFLAFYFFKVLRILADKYLSEKVSLRVKDAIDKLEIIVRTTVEADIQLYEMELKKALSDGKLEQKELLDIADKLAKKTMGMIAPDLDTLKKYFVGEGIADFVLNLVKKYIKETVFQKVSNKIDPFVQRLNPETK